MVNCNACKHLYVTWDYDAPRGCRAYGFKCSTVPSQVVLQNSGTECQLFEAKKNQSSGKSKDTSG